MSNIIKQYSGCVAFLLVLLLLLFTSCVEDNTIPPAIKESGDRTMVTFALKVPSLDTPLAETRSSLLGEDEERVNDVVVIAFKDGMYYYTARPKSYTEKEVFTVEMVKGNYSIMLLANYGKLPAFTVENSQDEVLATLKVSVENNNPQKWITNKTNAGYRAIPMASAVSGNIEIKETTNFTGVNSIKLHRSLARINVNILKDELGGGAGSVFEMTSIDVFNYNVEGYVTPKFKDGKHIQNVIPGKTELGPITYKYENPVTEVKNEIYLIEALNNEAWSDPTAVKTPLADAKRTCIVIGGSYKGSSKPHYYRVDFVYKAKDANGDETGELIHSDLLRNHSYVVNVKKIGGPGYDSVLEAFNEGPFNIESEIIVWDDGVITFVKSNGRYSVGVEKEEMKVPGEASTTNEMLVMTDFPGENIKLTATLSATNPDDTDAANKCEWISNITLTESQTGSNQGLTSYTLNYHVSEYDNYLNKGREGYIHLIADDICITIKVIQYPRVFIKFFKENKYGHWEEIDELVFVQENRETAPAAEKLRVEWAPESASLYLHITNEQWPGYKDLSWLEKPLEDRFEQGQVLGFIEFEIRPDMIADYEPGSFTEAKSTYYAEINSPIGNMESELIFKQYVKEVYIVPNTFVMDGKSHHSVTVKSNVDWQLYANKNISDGTIGTANVKVVEAVGGTGLDVMAGGSNKKAVPLFMDGKPNLPNGTQIPVTTIDDIYGVEPHIFLGHLGLYAESKDKPDLLNDSEDILCLSGIKQDGREANCYVLDPTSGVGILIPVRAANGVMVDKYNKFSGTISRGGKLYNGGVEITPQITSANPNYGAKLVWADECGSTGKGIESDALLSFVIPAGSGKDGYILVMPGDAQREGNAVVAVTRKDADNDADKGEILWSWHIWVTKGMKFEGNEVMQTRVMAGENGVDPSGDQYWLDRNLGALNNGGVGKTNIYTYGLHYQWGRKDPFPASGSVNTVSHRQLYHSTGKIAMSGDHGCVNYVASGTTVPNSIKAPDTYNAIGDRGDWLSSQIHTLWGVGYEGTDISTAGGEGANLGKSIFDPCPAGYRVPRREAKNWDDTGNKLHWGREYENLNSAMGNPTANIAVNYGFQWPGTNPYKGGWYSTAGHRYPGGLYTIVGSYGYCWSSSAVSNGARSLAFDSGYVLPSNYSGRDLGFSVRCVAE